MFVRGLSVLGGTVTDCTLHVLLHRQGGSVPLDLRVTSDGQRQVGKSSICTKGGT